MGRWEVRAEQEGEGRVGWLGWREEAGACAITPGCCQGPCSRLRGTEGGSSSLHQSTAVTCRMCGEVGWGGAGSTGG